MNEKFQKNCCEIKEKFALLTPEKRYLELIRMGQSLPAYPKELKTPDRIVRGCQSTLYLAVSFEGGKCFFQADSDALISKGLAALLIAIYSGFEAETVLKCPPEWISDLGLAASLSPTRSNGLAHIYLRMKQEAVQLFLMKS
ncbi:MAG: SufE family protein [Verrucomicrobia bacterium]|nr:SufE family protein [Verrucomicrobiota bacterium]MBU6446475.1 SufE family protein [Verrucomicrobiota bacterium]